MNREDEQPGSPYDADARLAPEALATVLENRHRFLGFLRSRVGSEDLAREILQDALVRGLERGGQLRDDESVIAWFYRLLRNAIVDHRRHAEVNARAVATWAREMDTTQPSAEDELHGAVCQCVSALLTTLKPEYAHAIRAVDLDGNAVGALADEQGITPNNASVRLYRARQALERRVRITCGACADHGCVDCSCAPSKG